MARVTGQVAVIDRSRLRRETVAAALRLSGLDAVAVTAPADEEVTLVLDASALDVPRPTLMLGAEVDIGVMTDAVQRALDGEGVMSPAPAEPAPTGASALSPREHDVLAALARGLTNAQIAAELDISEHTARTHVSNAYGKLGVTNRRAAALAARQAGLLDGRQ